MSDCGSITILSVHSSLTAGGILTAVLQNSILVAIVQTSILYHTPQLIPSFSIFYWASSQTSVLI